MGHKESNQTNKQNNECVEKTAIFFIVPTLLSKANFLTKYGIFLESVEGLISSLNFASEFIEMSILFLPTNKIN